MRLLLLSWLLLLLVAGRCSAARFLRRSEAQQGVHGARLGVPGAQQGFHGARPGVQGVQGLSDGRSALQLGRGSRTRVEDGGALSRARSPQGPEGNPRDPRQKEKFLKHLTGPLHFNPKCRKHFHRLYHNTRDCTIPAYYKRCARLLTRLANSPRCKYR